jgi:adenylylsulfate kinase-like enzyme
MAHTAFFDSAMFVYFSAARCAVFFCLFFQKKKKKICSTHSDTRVSYKTMRTLLTLDVWDSLSTPARLILTALGVMVVAAEDLAEQQEEDCTTFVWRTPATCDKDAWRICNQVHSVMEASEENKETRAVQTTCIQRHGSFPTTDVMQGERTWQDVHMFASKLLAPMCTFHTVDEWTATLTTMAPPDLRHCTNVGHVEGVPATQLLPRTLLHVGDERVRVLRLATPDRLGVAWMMVQQRWRRSDTEWTREDEKALYGREGHPAHVDVDAAWDVEAAHEDAAWVSGHLHVPYLKQLEHAAVGFTLDTYEVECAPSAPPTPTMDGDALFAFQTRNPLHGAHIAVLARGAVDHIMKREAQGQSTRRLYVQIQPAIGATQPHDVAASVRLQCYVAVLDTVKHQVELMLARGGEKYASIQVHVSVQPLIMPMRMAGPREALVHVGVRTNTGATGFIVGRDHAGPSCKALDGKPFYDPAAAVRAARELDVSLYCDVRTSSAVGYHASSSQWMAQDECEEGDDQEPLASVSGTVVRAAMHSGDWSAVPDWFSPPAVREILQAWAPPKVGTVWYCMGPPDAGKTLTAHYLQQYLRILEPRSPCFALDADVCRTHLSKGLGFSPQDRSMNVRRIGWVASRMAASGAHVVVANIAPFVKDRIANVLAANQVNVRTVWIDCSKHESHDEKALCTIRSHELSSIPVTGFDAVWEACTTKDAERVGAQLVQTRHFEDAHDMRRWADEIIRPLVHC